MMNPLRKFKKDNPDLMWIDISKKTGVSVQTLIDVMKRDEISIGRVSILTASKIIDGIGVDLLSFVKK